MIDSISNLATQYALIPYSFPTQFPATFGGDRMFYGLALFSLMIVALSATACLLEVYRLFRTYNEDLRSPAQMHRMALMGLLVAILMLSLPPAVFNLLWGEVKPTTLLIIRRIQIGCQAGSFIPMLFSMTTLSLSRHAITFQLIRLPLPVDLWSNRQQVMQSARIGLLCCLISALVAYAK